MHGLTALDLAIRHNYTVLTRFLTSASYFITNHDHYSLLSLCAPFSSPSLNRPISHSLSTTFMLCLLKTKRSQIDDIIAPSIYPAITLTSRLYDHEQALVRHILSYVGPNQGAPLSQHELDVVHAIERTSAPLHQTISSQQQVIASLKQTNESQQHSIASLLQTNAQLSAAIAALTTALPDGSDAPPASKRAKKK
jgi:hypothetical protein